jgi:hypothetical protein
LREHSAEAVAANAMPATIEPNMKVTLTVFICVCPPGLFAPIVCRFCAVQFV